MTSITEAVTPKEAILEALDRGDAKPWIWDEDGDEVIGRGLRVERRQTRFGEANFLILEVDGSERSILCGNQVLLGKLKGLHLQPGDWVGVRRGDERISQNGQTYRDFTVKTLVGESRELSFDRARALPESVDGELVDDAADYTDADVLPEDDAVW
jgi:hypothetical protein